MQTLLVRTAVAAAFALCVTAGGTAHVHAQLCDDRPLASRGAASPTHGFPESYTDDTGLELELCLSDPALCLFALPNDGAPISFPTNFPDEGVYWAAEAALSLSTGGSALLVLATEAAFLNGAVIDGDQCVFNRIRVVADGLTPGGTYTFAHPYGTEVLVADALGGAKISRDAGCDGTFDGPLTAPPGPWLVWDATPPAPPAGFIGDPAVEHTVTGSPCNQNFFRAAGPGLSVGDQTHLFSVVGRRFDDCGNGERDSGEDCDDGNRNDGDCCDTNCRFESDATPCDDGNDCTPAGLCDGDGTCDISGAGGGACDDGNACTIGDTCVGITCVGAAPTSCDDNDACTTDSCDAILGCLNTPNANPGCASDCAGEVLLLGPTDLTNGFPSIYQDSTGLALDLCDTPNSFCLPFAGVAPGAIVFPGNFPAELSYWAGLAALSLPNGGSAQLFLGTQAAFLNEAPIAGDQCTLNAIRILASDLTPNGAYTFTFPYGTRVLQADAGGAIRLTEDVGCDGTFLGPTTAPPAPFLVWDPITDAPPGFVGDPAVLHVVTGSPCGQNFFRVRGPGLPVGGTTTDQFLLQGRIGLPCGNGLLEAGEGEQCDDFNRADGDCCSSTCQFEASGASCDDANACTGADTCDGSGTCDSGPLLTDSCDDGNPCTANDTCSNGVCSGSLANIPCDDGDPCTANDTCIAGFCIGLPAPVPCDDGNPCTVDDKCDFGVCQGRQPACPSATVTADASAVQKSANSNFGSDDELQVDGDSPKHAFIRANVSNPHDTAIATATLNLQVASGSSAASNSGGRVHSMSFGDCNSWDEGTLTWNNQPPINNGILGAFGAVSSNQAVQMNVTASIPTSGNVCYAMDSLSSNGVDYRSREAASGGPSLSLTTVCVCGGPPPTTSTTTTTTPTTTTTVAGATTTTTTTTTTTLGGGLITTSVDEDVHTESKDDNTNFAGSDALSADASSEKNTFIKVSVSGTGGSVSSAIVRMTVSSANRADSDSGGFIQPTTCAWSEGTMDFNNEPATTGAAGPDQGAVNQDAVVDFDVSAWVTGDGQHCFRIGSNSPNGVDYNSMEAGSGQPEFIVN
jgi:cysteine-rich repeat protein